METVATPEAWDADPELVWRFYSQRRREAQASRPNAAHYALAELEKKIGKRFFLCSQNVDDLHERGGSRNMVHMHGELFKSRCEADCGAAAIEDSNSYNSLGEVPICACGGRLRPHIVCGSEKFRWGCRASSGRLTAVRSCWWWGRRERCIRRQVSFIGPKCVEVYRPGPIMLALKRH